MKVSKVEKLQCFTLVYTSSKSIYSAIFNRRAHLAEIYTLDH